MELSIFDEENARILLDNGEVFDGECLYCPAEYMLSEYGREEDALQIDDWIFYQSQITEIAFLPEGTARFWMGRTMHRMRLAPGPFSMMDRAEKTFELRLNDEKRREIKVGDVIRFENSDDAEEVLYVSVRALYRFSSFEELYRALPLEKCGYTAENVQSASPRDMDAYYTPEEQLRWGVLGIGIELL